MATGYHLEDEASDELEVSVGHVQEVRREWLVRTDEQFARRVQDEEIVLHLTDNRHRNEQIREDFPTASAVQARTDSIAQMEEQIRQKLIEDDAKLARKLHSVYESKESRRSSKTPKNIANSSTSYNSESSKSMIPAEIRDSRLPSSSKSKSERRISNGHQKHSQGHGSNKSSKSSKHVDQASARLDEGSEELDELGRVLGEPSTILKKEKERLIQEEEDAEIARRLENGNEDVEHRDRLLAHILQEKEYARYRKSEESHRPKQKHKVKSQSLAPNVDVSETYSIPHDVLQDDAPNFQSNDRRMSRERNLSDNNDPHYMIPIEEMNRHTVGAQTYKNLPKDMFHHSENSYFHQQSRNGNPQSASNRVDEYAEDPHYMEVLADLPPEVPQSQVNNGIYKSHRAPPEAPQLTGRPKLAEPPTNNSNCVVPETIIDERYSNKTHEKKNKKNKSHKEESEKRKCSNRCIIL